MTDPSKWLATLTRPILVVGNGALVSAVPEHEYGSVVRINNYVLGEYSGNRVTHWVANGFRDIQPKPVLTVLVPWTFALAKKRDHYVEEFIRNMKSEVIYLQSDRHISIWFPHATRSGKRFPTTGFCFLAWLRDNLCRFDIIGFDGMMTGHHGDPEHKHGHLWTRERESAILKAWKPTRR